MALINCPECGREVEDLMRRCSECGYPFEKEVPQQKYVNEQEVSVQELNVNSAGNVEEKRDVSGTSTNKLKTIKNWCIVFALCFTVLSGIFFYKGHDVKNNYYNSEYSILNKNAYVGGDAYNYIINGTYFIGYSVIGATFLLGAIILSSSAVNIYIGINSKE